MPVNTPCFGRDDVATGYPCQPNIIEELNRLIVLYGERLAQPYSIGIYRIAKKSPHSCMTSWGVCKVTTAPKPFKD